MKSVIVGACAAFAFLAQQGNAQAAAGVSATG
jgi:hypothetical protein